METINLELDAYEIANKIFSDTLEINNNISFSNLELKDFFEMLLIVTTEGLKKKYGDSEGNVDISLLCNKDIDKINSYLKKINIKMNIKHVENAIFISLNLHLIYKDYKQLKIEYNTKLNELNYIITNKNNIHIISFDFLQ